MIYVVLRRSAIDNDSKLKKINDNPEYLWIDYLTVSKPCEDVYLALNFSYFDEFKIYLSKIAIKKYYNHYLVKKIIFPILNNFMIRFFMHRDVTRFKIFFNIETIVDRRKRFQNKSQYYLKNNHVRKIYRFMNAHIYKDDDNKYKIISDAEFISGKFYDL